MTKEIQLSDHGGDYDAFCEACYQAYLAFWAGNPTFDGKTIQRNAANLTRGKENDFWGIVDGHDPNKQHSTDRYSKVPLLGYVISPENVASGDVLSFKRLDKRKIKIEIFSQSRCYLIVLQEVGRTGRLQFITAHPLSAQQVKKKRKQYEEFVRGGGEPL